MQQKYNDYLSATIENTDIFTNTNEPEIVENAFFSDGQQ